MAKPATGAQPPVPTNPGVSAPPVAPPPPGVTYAPPMAPPVAAPVQAPAPAAPPIVAAPPATAYDPNAYGGPPPATWQPPASNGYAPPPGAPAGYGQQASPFARFSLAGVNDQGGGRLLPADLEYEGEIVSAKPDRSTTGNDMIALEIVVTFPVAYKGAKLYDQVVLNESSIWKLKALARCTDTLDPTESYCTAQSEQEFIGHIIRFRTFQDEYQGRFKSKIDGGYSPAFETPGLTPPAAA